MDNDKIDITNSVELLAAIYHSGQEIQSEMKDHKRITVENQESIKKLTENISEIKETQKVIQIEQGDLRNKHIELRKSVDSMVEDHNRKWDKQREEHIRLDEKHNSLSTLIGKHIDLHEVDKNSIILKMQAIATDVSVNAIKDMENKLFKFLSKWAAGILVVIVPTFFGVGYIILKYMVTLEKIK